MRFLRSTTFAAAFLSSTALAQAPSDVPLISQPFLWHDFINIDQLSDKIKPDIVQSLNWLETHFGGFHEILWNLKDRQEAGSLDKVTFIEDWRSYYQRQTATIGLSYNPNPQVEDFWSAYYYLGVDRKFYHFSLNELLAHELQHGAQENSMDVQALLDSEEALREKITPKAEALKTYLVSRGITDPYASGKHDMNFDKTRCEVGDYVFANDRAALDKETCDKTILEDPEYIRLHQEWFALRLQLDQFSFPQEQDAMDITDSLSGLLGKAARGHYHDSNLFYHLIDKYTKTPHMAYTDAPEIIRQMQQWTLYAPEEYEAYPLITGDPANVTVNVQEMQCGWTNQWNADSKNISVDGWIEINDAKMDFFAAHDFYSLTSEDKKSYDDMIKVLLNRLNRESGLDICPMSPSP